MSAAADSPVQPGGIEAPIGNIDKELSKLWEQGGEGKTRASLVNLAIYTEDPHAVAANTDLIAAIASEHACRAILILAEPEARQASARAWIGAHCHLAGKGEICSEQITFHLRGEACASLPATVFSHLDSDLPLYFWWQAEFPANPDARLWNWVDRLIFDSASWAVPGDQFDRVLHIFESARHGRGSARELRLADLNWTRLLPARFAFASLFDTEAAIATLPDIDRVEIQHGPGARTAALLFLGWIATRMGWKPAAPGSAQLSGPEEKTASFHLEECPAGAGLQRCVLASQRVKFIFAKCRDKPLFELRSECDGMSSPVRLLHAGGGKVDEVLLDELGRGGTHPLFFLALQWARTLL